MVVLSLIAFMLGILLMLEGRRLIGFTPLKYQVTFKSPKSMAEICQLIRDLLSQVDQKVYFRNDFGNITISKASPDATIEFGFQIVCFFSSCEGNCHFENDKLYSQICMEGNYFISRKKATANQIFINELYNLLMKEECVWCSVMRFFNKKSYWHTNSF